MTLKINFFSLAHSWRTELSITTPLILSSNISNESRYFWVVVFVFFTLESLYNFQTWDNSNPSNNKKQTNTYMPVFIVNLYDCGVIGLYCGAAYWSYFCLENSCFGGRPEDWISRHPIIIITHSVFDQIDCASQCCISCRSSLLILKSMDKYM